MLFCAQPRKKSAAPPLFRHRRMDYDIQTALRLHASPSLLWRPLDWLGHMTGDDSWRERLDCTTFRYGIKPKTINTLVDRLSRDLRATRVREVHFTEEWHDRQAMRRGQRWVCKRIPTNASGEPLPHDGPFAYTSTWTAPAEAFYDYGSRCEDFGLWTAWDDNGGAAFARFSVHRIIMLAEDAVYACDRITFENDSDVYCVFSAATLSAYIPDAVGRALDDVGAVWPVRDDIVEYLFRHDREAYDDVIGSRTVPRLIYCDMRQTSPRDGGK